MPLHIKNNPLFGSDEHLVILCEDFIDIELGFMILF